MENIGFLSKSEKGSEEFTNLKPEDIDTKITVITTKDGYIDVEPDSEIGGTPTGMANAVLGIAGTALLGFDNAEDKNEWANTVTLALAKLFAGMLGEEK